jgi:hypothetical protein
VYWAVPPAAPPDAKNRPNHSHGYDRRHAESGISIKEFVMPALETQLIERLKKLPPSRVAEVVDFVEFLASREERVAAAQRLTEGLAKLDALDLPPISDDEIEAEVQASRQARRAQQAR